MTSKQLKSLELFAGCGGLVDGFEQTHLYNTIACVEWEKSPCENLEKRLREKWKYKDACNRVIRFDIQRTQELINGWSNDIEYGTGVGLDKLVDNAGGVVDLVVGGPPCQAYSIAGRIRDENGMQDDYRNYLFEKYIEIVDHYKPKIFVFENVPGMLTAAPGGVSIVTRIRESFESIGYEIPSDLREAVIDFTEYGVPQNRKRVIILGLRKDYFETDRQQVLESFYKEILPQYKSEKKTVYEAIGDLPPLYPSEKDYKIGGKKFSHKQGTPIVNNHIPRYHSRRDMDIFALLAEDIAMGRYEYISAEALKKLYTDKTGKESNVHKYYVIRYNEQSNTIPAHLYKDGLRHIHPDFSQARTLTVREAARLQTFSDDYEFIGTMMQQYKMIGNAVPPLFAKKLAQAVAQILYRENK